jgi:MraZ protein
VFLGEHHLRLDEKGRLVLPAKWRDALAEGLVLARGQERCVTVWPEAEFERAVGSLRTAPATNQTVRDYTRMLAAGAIDDVPDRQGRVTVPPALREWSGLDRDCVVIGLFDRAEVWDSPAWAQYSAEHEDAFARVDLTALPGTALPV